MATKSSKYIINSNLAMSPSLDKEPTIISYTLPATLSARFDGVLYSTTIPYNKGFDSYYTLISNSNDEFDALNCGYYTNTTYGSYKALVYSTGSNINVVVKANNLSYSAVTTGSPTLTIRVVQFRSPF